uniref:G protein-coupled receptor n=1 Tax=Ascaris lumbricoides TaxID=6252 RepID=A0A0M3I0V1_ASCLU
MRSQNECLSALSHRSMRLLVVRDESSKILGHRWLNSQISFYIGLLQLSICIWAMAQHFFSLVNYHKILFCDFVNGTKPVLLVGVDIIIFDIGLFHSLWGIDSCVAQHLDGGYGRFGWCFFHIAAFIICLPFAFVSRPKPYSLWPLLIQQSAYGVGLLILSLAALPRVLPTFTGERNSASLFSVSVYAAGASLNFLLLYIYWHWYWHVEAMWNSARKLRGNHMIINPNNRSKRTMVRHHEPCDTTVMAVNQYDVSSERAVLVNTCRDEVPSKEGQLEETPLVSINATVADSRSYEMPPESTDSFLPSQRHNNTTVQRTDSQNYRQSENKIGTFELKRDSTHSSSPICNENCHAERCRAVYTPELYANPSHDISSDIVAPTSHICNGSLASSQVCSRRPSYRFGVYPLRRPRRLLPSYHVPSPPTDLSAVPLQRPIVRPSPRRRLHPLSVAEAEFIFAKQPMLQYSPFRHLPI